MNKKEQEANGKKAKKMRAENARQLPLKTTPDKKAQQTTTTTQTPITTKTLSDT